MDFSRHLLKLTGGMIVTVLFCAAIIASASVALSESDRIMVGTVAFGTPLGGMTKADAEDFFEKTAKERITADSIVLRCGEADYVIKPIEIHLAARIDDAVNEAYNVGRSGTVLENLREQIRCALNGHSVSLGATYDETALGTKLAAIAAVTDAQPANAFVSVGIDGAVYRTNGIIGKKLDTEKIKEELSPKLTALKLPLVLEIAPDDILPYVGDADLAAVDSILASYTTYFSVGDRGDNIAIAASRLNGALIKSGTAFSFNTAVGRRTRDAGYKDAGVFIDGRLEQDIGGGVCQVSSTLYNAILLAGLTSTVRTPHYYPSAYCPPGRDATVADGLLDFQFKNPYPHNVYLISSVMGNSLTIYVLGTWADLNGNMISLENEGSDLNPAVYRVYAQNGQIIEREFLHSDAYSSPELLEQH